MRALRLLLLVMMLAFLPLPGWAAALAHAVVSTTAAAGVPGAAIVDADVDVAGADGAHQAAVTGEPANDPLPLPEAAEPQWQPGADLAEQLLPAAPLRLAPWSGRAGPPRYAGALLPEPDLPRLPRPPRA